MYTYLETTINHNIPVAWFAANDRSLYEVAFLYQERFLKKEFIQAVKYGKTIYVGFTNFDEWKLVTGEKYHIHTVLANTKGYVRLGLPLEMGEYVAGWFRPKIEEILPATWLDIFQREIAPFECPSEEVEYADYADPIDLNEPVIEEELESYDLDYTDAMYADYLPDCYDDTDYNTDLLEIDQTAPSLPNYTDTADTIEKW